MKSNNLKKFIAKNCDEKEVDKINFLANTLKEQGKKKSFIKRFLRDVFYASYEKITKIENND